MLVPPEKQEAYLFGSLWYAGILWQGQAELLAKHAVAYRLVMSRGFFHLPYYLIYDLHALVTRGFEAPFASDSGERSHLSPNAAELSSRYEREFLGRLLQSPHFSAALEIIATAEASTPLANRLLLLLADRFQAFYPSGPLINPAQLRDLELPNPSELHPPKRLEDLGDLAAHFEPALETFLAEIGEHVRWAQLLRTEDFFELTHLDVLKDDHLRVGCRQIVQLDRELAEDVELDLDLSTHETEAETKFVDETHYPTGGLTGLTNRGSFENLVMSELIYLDESEGDISLFDLRYVEDELLFYMRDSGLLRRKRRTIHFIIDLGPLFHLKSTFHRYQYAVVAQGLCLRLLHDFFQIFEKDSLRFVLHYLPTGEPDKLAEEQEMMRLLLHDYVQHGWVRFETCDESVALTGLIDEKRKSYVVILTQSENLETWQLQQQLLESEDLPLFCSVLALDAQDASSLPPTRVETLQQLLG